MASERPSRHVRLRGARSAEGPAGPGTSIRKETRRALPIMRLDAACAGDHPLMERLDTTRSTARGRTEVARSTRAHRCDRLHRWLAACFAAFLAVGPLAHPSTPVVLAGAPVGSPEALIVHDGGGQGQQPAAELRPSQTLAPGILSRTSLPATTFGLPPVEAPLLSPALDQSMFAMQAAISPRGEPRGVLQRSSVGTARTPTGPPA